MRSNLGVYLRIKIFKINISKLEIDKEAEYGISQVGKYQFTEVFFELSVAFRGNQKSKIQRFRDDDV